MDTVDSKDAQNQRTLGRPFVKGQSGNPGGQPKGTPSLVREIKRQLKANPKRAEELANAAIQHAIDGNAQFMKLIIDRLDGATVQRLAVGELTPEQILQALAATEEPDEDPE